MAEKLKFKDFKTRKSFMTDKYEIVKKGRGTFAVATAPSGIKAYRAVKKDFLK